MIVCAFFGSAALALGATGSTKAPVLSGPFCVSKSTGVVSLLGSAKKCAKGETLYSGVVGTAGPKGSTGSPGPQGPAGPQGSPGATGNAGSNGSTGSPGPQGPKGDAGAVGATGAAGPTGAKGDTGATGAVGPQGDKGDTGATGVAGPAGADGAVGPKGDTGAAGADGAVGPAGPVGATGPAGPKGDTGATGAVGPAGPPGPQGAQGFTGAPGAAGATGPQGPAGATPLTFGPYNATSQDSGICADNNGTGNPGWATDTYTITFVVAPQPDGSFIVTELMNGSFVTNATSSPNDCSQTVAANIHGTLYGDYVVPVPAGAAFNPNATFDNSTLCGAVCTSNKFYADFFGEGGSDFVDSTNYAWQFHYKTALSQMTQADAQDGGNSGNITQ